MQCLHTELLNKSWLLNSWTNGWIWLLIGLLQWWLFHSMIFSPKLCAPSLPFILWLLSGVSSEKCWWWLWWLMEHLSALQKSDCHHGILLLLIAFLVVRCLWGLGGPRGLESQVALRFSIQEQCILSCLETLSRSTVESGHLSWRQKEKRELIWDLTYSSHSEALISLFPVVFQCLEWHSDHGRYLVDICYVKE